MKYIIYYIIIIKYVFCDLDYYFKIAQMGLLGGFLNCVVCLTFMKEQYISLAQFVLMIPPEEFHAHPKAPTIAEN